MPELDDATHQQVTALAKEGDALVEKGELLPGIAAYADALHLLPKPWNQWEAATWLYVAIGDAYWQKGDRPRAFKSFRAAVISPGGLGNPFIHLRLGQIALDEGDRERARDELIRAYMGDGERVFAREDPKYLDAIRDLL